jgi:tetratricopeptide (TPR) repeat protein
MRRKVERRWLPAFAILAAMAVVSPGAFGQAEPAATAPTPQPQQTAAAPKVPPTPEALGDSLMGRQRYQAAIEAYKKAPRDSAVVLNKMGIAYQMMFNLEEALHCYQASLRLDPKNARVFNNLGTVYDSLKQYGNAERMYRKALKLEPDSPVILKNLGSDQLAQHKYKKGWEAYKAALALDPNIFENSSSPRVENPASVQERGAMNYYMAKGCVRAGMNDRAIEYLRMALNEGFTSPKKIIADSEFAGLKGIPAFEQLLAAQGTP